MTFLQKVFFILKFITVAAGSFVMLAILVAFGWVGILLTDKKIPIDVIRFDAEDTIVGEPVLFHLDLYRTRSCAATITRYANDASGRLIFSETQRRPVNGEKGRVTLDERYKLSDKTVPGVATMIMYIEWVCPDNFIHKYFPLSFKYYDTFKIFPKPEPSTGDTSLDIRRELDRLEDYEKARQNR